MGARNSTDQRDGQRVRHRTGERTPRWRRDRKCRGALRRSAIRLSTEGLSQNASQNC